MKKNRTMRAAVLMLALTLITSCFVGSTFAKYTTGISGNDTARVAKFGVELQVNANLFEKTYDGDNAITVKATDSDVIAPGTTGTATAFTIAGAPEVDVAVDITLDDNDALQMVFLKNQDSAKYTDYTDLNTNVKFDVDADYYPVYWTLTFTPAQGGTGTNGIKAQGNLQVIENYLNSISGHYDVEGENGQKKFSDIIGDYVLTWAWGYDSADKPANAPSNDQADTYLGQLAANKDEINTADSVVEGTDYNLTEAFKLKVTVVQVDDQPVAP